MKLAISLLVLAGFGQLTSTLTTEEVYIPNPNVKRELPEGNFGDRTPIFHKFDATDAVPGIQYVRNLKQDLEDSTPHNQIFGARLPPISKISDLLTGQGPPFEVALANHLYSPISVYNAKTPSPGLFQVTFPAKMEKPKKKSSSKSSKKQKQPSSEETNDDDKFTDFVTKQASFYPTDDYQVSPHYNPKIAPLLPSFVRVGEESSLLKGGFLHHKSLPSHVFIHAEDKPSLKFSSKHSTQNPPLHYYQHQPLVHFAPKYYQYYNPEAKQEENENTKKDESQQQYDTTGRPEYQHQRPIVKQGYYSHPNGAISYASYTSNQGPAEQPKYQLQYEQTTDAQPQTYAPPIRYQPIYVPEYVYPNEQPGAQKATSPQPQQKYVHVPQQQYVQAPAVQQSSPAEKASEPTYVPIPQQQYNELYLNPARHQLLYELQRGHAPEPVQYQQQYQAYVSTATPQPEAVVQHVTPAPQHYATPSHAYYPAQSPQQDVVHILPQQRYSPVPVAYGHSATPYYPSPTPSAQQVSVTPKAHTQQNQGLQATTLEPEILQNPRGSEAHPRSLNPTSHSLHSSPESLQSLSTPAYPSSTTPKPQQPQHYASPSQSVQIQQQELHELHSQLAPLLQAHKQPQQPQQQRHENYLGSTLPGEYQALSTSRPTEPTKPDYEIEISANVDHSQLPKDLQPVKTQVTLAQEQKEHKTEHSQPQEHTQTQPQQIDSQSKHTLVEHTESQTKQSQSEVEHGQPKAEQSQQNSHPQQEQNQPQQQLYQHPTAIATHEVPPPHVTVQHYDPNVPYLTPVLHPVSPVLQPQVYTNGQNLVLQSHVPPQPPSPPVSPAPVSPFSPLQFFGKFAESIFGGIQP